MSSFRLCQFLRGLQEQISLDRMFILPLLKISLFQGPYTVAFLTDENPRSQSYKTLIWGLFVRTIGGAHPRLYSYQNSLPRMPVPNLHGTCQGYLKSVKHILQDNEYEEMKKLAVVCSFMTWMNS